MEEETKDAKEVVVKKKSNNMIIGETKSYYVDFSEVDEEHMEMAKMKAKKRVQVFTLCNDDDIKIKKMEGNEYLYEVRVDLSKISV